MPEIGQNLSHYTLVEKIGKGGMGVVYQAKDQKLGRDVAIKVLPEEFAKDAERVARFQREAKLLASLNHPNIAAIYGLEESGGTHFLVLELVEGDTLSDRIKAGPIPVEESLKLALQIAEALEAAHEKGVIHRDLKPANIKVTPDGKIKVLDFGLAKAFAGDQGEMILSDSPTLSVAATQQGVILGTAAYMSPEQAKGKPIDKRTDIWAFGCVLFEMLTGRSMFAADDVSQTLARVLERQPDFAALPPNLHPKIIEMLERCLEKEAKNRYSGISDARVDIQKVLADPRGVLVKPVSVVESRKNLRMILPWVTACIVLTAIIVGIAVWRLKPAPPPESRGVTRFIHDLPTDQKFSIEGTLAGHLLAVSPDGSQFVYSANKGLYLRSLDELDARLISGTDEYSQSPFFSPDGRWIGYWSQADAKLKKIAIRGGAPVVLCDANIVYGAIWNVDNMILYAERWKGIMRVSSNGGTPEILVKVENSAAPQLIAHGKWVIFTNCSTQPHKIIVQAIESGEQKELFAGDFARYLPTGHLVYKMQNSNSLSAVPFDINTLEVKGGPVPIVEGMLGLYALSNSGTLAYLPGTNGGVTSRRTLVWVDREGKEEPLSAAPNDYGLPKISPDGTRVALGVNIGGNKDIWIWDLVRENITRFTFDEAEDNWPLWTLDGQRIVFHSKREEPIMGSIYWKAADGTGEVERLDSSSERHNLFPFSWSRDGKTLLFIDLTQPPQADIGMLSIEGNHVQKLLLHEEHNEDHPQISPDGQWIAYASNESGRNEVYVRPYPEVDNGIWQVSANGGASPLWSPDGRELFYRNGESVMAVSVESEPIFKPAKPKELFRGTYYSVSFVQKVARMWDISPDGKRFLMMKEAASTDETSAAEAPRKINIVLNWFEELKERIPVH